MEVRDVKKKESKKIKRKKVTICKEKLEKMDKFSLNLLTINFFVSIIFVYLFMLEIYGQRRRKDGEEK